MLRKLKFCLVGSLNMLFDYSAFYLVTSLLGWHYSVAQAAGYIVAQISSYNLNKLWTFRSDDVFHPPFRENGWRFIISNMISFLVSLGILTLLSKGFGVSYFSAKLVAGGASWILNYNLFKHFVFTGHKKNPGRSARVEEEGSVDYSA